LCDASFNANATASENSIDVLTYQRKCKVGRNLRSNVNSNASWFTRATKTSIQCQRKCMRCSNVTQMQARFKRQKYKSKCSPSVRKSVFFFLGFAWFGAYTLEAYACFCLRLILRRTCNPVLRSYNDIHVILRFFQLEAHQGKL